MNLSSCPTSHKEHPNVPLVNLGALSKWIPTHMTKLNVNCQKLN